MLSYLVVGSHAIVQTLSAAIYRLPVYGPCDNNIRNLFPVHITETYLVSSRKAQNKPKIKAFSFFPHEKMHRLILLVFLVTFL